MGKRVAIIGAGIAGLSAASYLQRNGFDTEILEMHDKPGGLCTAWKRGGYTFDGCIHWLMGSGETSNLHHIWKELGAGELDYVEWEVYTTVGLAGGDSFSVYTDPDRLAAEMVRLSPEDSDFARFFASKVRAVKNSDLPAAYDKLGFRGTLSFLASLPKALPILTKWTKVPVSKLCERIKGPKLREAFEKLFGESMDGFPSGALFMMLGFMAKKSSGYPIGGSLAFARAIEAKYLSLGGKIRYGFKVDRILVEGGAAVGVLGGKNGSASTAERIGADYVVSAADAHDTLYRLLGGSYPSPELDKAFAGGMKLFPSLLFIGLGLNRDCSDLPHMQSFELDEPIVLEEGKLQVKRLGLHLFNFDPSLAPAGKTAATVMIETGNDAYWRELAENDPVAYASRKREAADKVIAALDRRVPGLASWVDTVDVATPRSFFRYTNNWRGSYEGWLPTAGSMGTKLPRTLKGLEHFHMVGQWLNPGGGLPPCGMDGRNLAKRLCKAEGLRFDPDGTRQSAAPAAATAAPARPAAAGEGRSIA
jgi:phytoene dehydrogenase-like protein